LSEKKEKKNLLDKLNIDPEKIKKALSMLNKTNVILDKDKAILNLGDITVTIAVEGLPYDLREASEYIDIILMLGRLILKMAVRHHD
jgi:hypothetical protein